MKQNKSIVNFSTSIKNGSFNKNRKNKNILISAIFITVAVNILFLCINTALASTVDTSSFSTVNAGFFHFFDSISAVLNNILNDTPLTNFANVLWKFFAVISIVWLFAMYAMRGTTTADMFSTIFMIILVKVLMGQYDTITTALWGWSEGFAGGIQKAATGQDNLLYLASYIWHTCARISFGTPTLIHPIALITTVIMTFFTGLLACLGAFVTVWALWGYAIMKMIGFMIIPCILFKNLSWLFDGWSKCFIGFLLYNIIARANLVLVVKTIESYFNIQPMTQTNNGMIFNFHSITDGIGLICFLILGIVALFSTSSMVRAIMSGSTVGISEGIRKMSTTVGTLV